MNTLLRTMIAAIALSPCSTQFAKADDADLPVVVKNGISISAWRFGNYYATPTAKEPQYNSWSWRPRYSFQVKGPLPGGSQLSISFFKPDGAAWMTQRLQTPEIAKDGYATIVNPSSGTQEDARQCILTTGQFSFKINLKNELTSVNKTIFSGKFTVNKFHSGPDVLVNKRQFEYYVEHDWLIPYGYLYVNDREMEEAPRLSSIMWFRGNLGTEDVSAYLYYKGKQICSTKNPEQGGTGIPLNINTADDDKDYVWKSFLFNFYTVASKNKMTSANNFDGMHFLDKNPGEYEIKVLVKGKLARTAKFAVGDDGMLVEDPATKKLGLIPNFHILPVTVILGSDGRATPASYKTDAFYGNPVEGFLMPK